VARWFWVKTATNSWTRPRPGSVAATLETTSQHSIIMTSPSTPLSESLPSSKSPTRQESPQGESHHHHLRLLTHADGLPHVIFGPLCLVFSTTLSHSLGVPLRPTQYFLIAFTAYGGLVLWGLRRHPRGDVPNWLVKVALAGNGVFLGAVTASLVAYGWMLRRLTMLGWWLHGGMLASAVCVLGLIGRWGGYWGIERSGGRRGKGGKDS
jgi:hypothetical protein